MNAQLQNLKNLFRNARSRTIILVTIALLVVVVLMGSVRFFRQVNIDNHSNVQLQAIDDIQSVPGGLNKSPSQAYMRLQEQQNIQQAQRAARTGRSAVPTIVDSFQLQKTHDSEENLPCCCTPCQDNQQSPVRTGKLLGTPPLYPSDLQAGTLVYDANGQIIGTVGADGKVRDKNGTVIGQVGPDGLVRDLVNSVIGSAAAAAEGGQVYDSAGHLMGTVGADGKVRDANGRVIGTVGADGIVRDKNGAVVGRLQGASNRPTNQIIPGTPVYDAQGRLIATVGADGKVRDANGRVIGTVGADGLVRDADGKLLGKAGATAPGTPVYDAQGRLMGTVGADGIIRDSQGRALGTANTDGIVRDALGQTLGSTTPPREVAETPKVTNTTQLKEQASSGILGHTDPEIQAILDRQAAQLSEQKAELLKQQMQSAMGNQIAQLFGVWATLPAQQVMVGIPLVEEAGMRSQAQQNASDKAASTLQPEVKAGSIMYAVLLTAVNSDEPGPVLAKIVEGKFKGGRLIGTLSNLGERVLLQFNKLNLPNVAQSIAVNTVAIDHQTARTALSSSTDRHLLLRYGSLLASSFIQGYGQAFQQSGAVIANTPGGGTIVTYPQLSPEGKLLVALGTVGSQFGSAVGGRFNTPPTVKVYAGTAVGVLFIEDLPALPQ